MDNDANSATPDAVLHSRRAKMLIEALPYIKKFRGKRIVIKLGGAVLDEKKLEKRIIDDIVLLHFVGILPIIVHGGGKQISRMMARLGKKNTFVDGKRVTDEETMSIAQMVLSGVVNKSLVSLVSQVGSEAIGISGQDGKLIQAKRVAIAQGGDLGLVGRVSRINISYLERLYSQQIIPVIAPIATGEDGKALNVNADEVATEVACALCVERLIFVSDVRGVMLQEGKSLSERENGNGGKKRLLSKINIAEIPELKRSGQISGGMIVKLEAAKQAIEEGVRGVQIVSGLEPHSLLIELFSDSGVGTKIV